MNRKKHGLRRGSRNRLTMKSYERGKIRIKAHLQSFNIGDMVQLVADPMVQKGMFHIRFYGKKGIVVSKQGRSYKVTIMDHNKKKSFVVNPVHLQKA